MKLVPGKADTSTSTAAPKAMPLPEDAPFLTFAEAGAYLRLSAASVRKLVDGRSDSKNDELGTLLRSWVVRISPHRRYVQRDRFLEWLHRLAKGA